MRKNVFRTVLIAVGLSLAPGAMAGLMHYSFGGNFSADDDVQLFNFTVDGASQVTLLSYGYGGGTNAAGVSYGAGGFDPILTLFDSSSGALVAYGDDGPSTCFNGAEASAPGVDAGNSDPVTGLGFDTCFTSILAAGSYTVALTQYDNYTAGNNIANGFVYDGQGNFTAGVGGCSNGMFCDASGNPASNNRTSTWAFDVLNVFVTDMPQAIPVPGTLALLGLGLVALVRSKRSHA